MSRILYINTIYRDHESDRTSVRHLLVFMFLSSSQKQQFQNPLSDDVRQHVQYTGNTPHKLLNNYHQILGKTIADKCQTRYTFGSVLAIMRCILFLNFRSNTHHLPTLKLLGVIFNYKKQNTHFRSYSERGIIATI